MTNYPPLFNKTPDQLRQIGARGGRAHGRNWRARQRATQAAAVSQPMAGPLVRALETTAQAIAALDLQFPWLRRAERRTSRRPSTRTATTS
jgi:hypothetical protein